MITIKDEKGGKTVEAKGSIIDLANDITCLLNAIAKDDDLKIAYMMGYRAYLKHRENGEDEEDEEEEDDDKQCNSSWAIN